MVNTYDDKDPACSQRRVSNINTGYEEGDDEQGVCYDSVEPDEVEKGVVAIATPAFGSIAVVDSSNVHFGNKTYYQGPVTVLKQTIVSPSEKQKTSSDFHGLPPKDIENNSAINKVRLALCPASKRRQRIATAAALTAVALLLSVYLSVFIGHVREGGAGPDDSGRPRLGDTGDGTPADVYTNPPNDSDTILDRNYLRIRKRAEWLAQPPVGEMTDLETPVPNVIITHSASEGCFSTSECVVRVRTIQAFHIESRGWYDIGYNYLVGGEGAVYEGRGWDKVGAHSLGWNNVSIGICLIGTFTTMEPTRKQITATHRLIERGVKLGKISQNYRLLAHRQVQSTESPGRRLFSIMQTWPHWYNTSLPQD